MLSPLRFHYDSESFNPPVRLGLLNSSGVQDLLVHVLASERDEVANYPNAFVPTNLEVKESARAGFGKFYVALLDAVMRQQPGAVVTEYAWQANNCDPCPETPLQLEELVTLGADVLPSYAGRVKSADGSASWQVPGEFVSARTPGRHMLLPRSCIRHPLHPAPLSRSCSRRGSCSGYAVLRGEKAPDDALARELGAMGPL